jgi:hypothetical protein
MGFIDYRVCWCKQDDETGRRFAGTIAVQRYARGLALAALERVEEAEQEYELFLAAKARVPETRKHLIYNTCK